MAGQWTVDSGHGWCMFGWSWIEASLLRIQLFGQDSMEGCDSMTAKGGREVVAIIISNKVQKKARSNKQVLQTALSLID